MTTIVYYLSDAAELLAQSYTAYISGRHYSEDGAGYRVDESRAFCMSSQTECGYAGEFREPFAREAFAYMQADMTDDETEQGE